MRPLFVDRGLAVACTLLAAIGIAFSAHGVWSYLSGSADAVTAVIAPVAFFLMAAMLYGVDRHERSCEACQRAKRELEELDKYCAFCGQRLSEERRPEYRP